MRLLLADDEKNLRLLLSDLLTKAGYQVDTAENGDEALRKLASNPYDLLLTDLKMPYVSGMEIIRELSTRKDAPVMIMMTAFSTVEVAVEAMKLGAFDFIVKPVDPNQLLQILEKASAVSSQQAPARPVRTGTGKKVAGQLVGDSPAMTTLKDLIARVAPVDVSVLIQGESGTGKELVARAIHAASGRASGPFVAVNCAALNENLIESEFFGHEKGAFTGAADRRIGRFELADGGTIFLDEIGDLPFSLQAKLLRVLQERQIERVGGVQTIPINVRVIAATCQDLKKKLVEGTFREDLFFRLAVFPLVTPPLRNRPEDIPVLTGVLLGKLAGQLGVKVPQPGKNFLDSLAGYHWPGNVRELENQLMRLLILQADKPEWNEAVQMEGVTQKSTPVVSEDELLVTTLRRTNCNISQTAEKLGVSRVTIYARIKALQLNLAELRG
ncbi:MAG: sigma-54-dependent Fis family transcriptional regulator [Bacteroidetes bacterium]|nr:sigma-54-dependent Fis family transcriptional regulator [Bacteroidota bacterium]